MEAAPVAIFHSVDRAFLLDFRVGRQILKRQNIARGKADDGVRIGSAAQLVERLQHGDELFGGVIVGNDHNQRPAGGLLQQDQQQSLGGRSKSGDTNTPRALFQMGGHTRKGGQFFHVREEIANEGENHRSFILTGAGTVGWQRIHVRH